MISYNFENEYDIKLIDRPQNFNKFDMVKPMTNNKIILHWAHRITNIYYLSYSKRGEHTNNTVHQQTDVQKYFYYSNIIYPKD